VARIRAAITQPPPDLESEVEAFLGALQERGLLEIGPAPSDTGGLSGAS
jgi:hypothetical protein